MLCSSTALLRTGHHASERVPNAEGTVDDHRRERRPELRVHLSQAAEIMGVSKDAVRMRVKRGTMRSEKGEDGRVYVWVNVDPDGEPNTVHTEPQVAAWRELIEELRDRVRSLEDANRENRRIIAALTQRIPEIESPPREQEAPASPEPTGSPTAATEQSGRVEGPPVEVEGAQEGAEPRSWWRRVFGG
jgi:hypothetical protein